MGEAVPGNATLLANGSSASSSKDRLIAAAASSEDAAVLVTSTPNASSFALDFLGSFCLRGFLGEGTKGVLFLTAHSISMILIGEEGQR